MSVIEWLKEKVFGKNGYDAEAQDLEIKQIKDESKTCIDRAQTHLGDMRQEFTKLHRKDTPREEPV